MAYKLSSYAQKDIEDILTYTLETWGILQFQKYQILIENTLKAISEDPALAKSRSREELFPLCRSYAFGKHIIFYRLKNEIVEIVRILHERMDIDSQIPEEY